MASTFRHQASGWLLILALVGCSRANPLFDQLEASDSATREGPVAEAMPSDTGQTEPIPAPPEIADALGMADGPANADGRVADLPADSCPGGCGPLVHWRFDEAAGTVAADASGNGFDGSYVGETALPQPSTSVPSTGFANPRSRQFPASGRPAVQLVDGVARLGLTPSNEMTLSAWFQATAAGGAGGDVVNLADSFLIRIKPTQIELAKRVSNDPGSSYIVAIFMGSASFLDGRWHHVAGVLAATGVSLYVDGVMRVTDPAARPLIFVQRELLVGRREAGATNNFQGGIDDVRVYRRALAATEVLEIARGVR